MLVATAFTFGSCSNDSSENAPDVGEKTAQVQITLKGVADTRATDTSIPTQNAENTINRYTVIIFNSDKTVNAIQSFDGTSMAANMSCKPAAGCFGIVVANAPSDNYFAGVSNMAGFLAKTIALESAQTPTSLPMSGEILSGSSKTFVLNAGTNSGFTVALSRLVARVSISSIKTDFNASGQYANATFTPRNIFIRNAQSVVIPITGDATLTTPSSATFLKGNYADYTSGEGFLTEATSGATEMKNTTTPYTKNFWFYLFPNASSSYRTALVIEGLFKTNSSDTGTRMFYPIIINKTQLNTTITEKDGSTVTTVDGTSNPRLGSIDRNKTYALTATIRTIGTTDPDGTIEPASLSITVNIANWVLDVTQDVGFN